MLMDQKARKLFYVKLKKNRKENLYTYLNLLLHYHDSGEAVYDIGGKVQD